MASTSASEDARAAFNIKVLRRHDPRISHIVYSTSFVVLYEYAHGAWTKSGIEGPMFLYRRETQSPHYGMFVLNRNGVDNYATHITRDDDLEVTDDFVIFRPAQNDQENEGEEDEDDSIVGIWVFEKDQRRLMGEQMTRLQELADQEDVDSVEDTSIQQPGTGNSSSTGEQISLDALFSPPAAPKSSTPLTGHAGSASTTQPALLDAIFSSASGLASASASAPSPAPSSIQSYNTASGNGSATASKDVESASAGLMAMLGLGPSPGKKQAAPQQRSAEQQAPSPLPTNNPELPVVEQSSAPSVAPGLQALFSSVSGPAETSQQTPTQHAGHGVNGSSTTHAATGQGANASNVESSPTETTASRLVSEHLSKKVLEHGLSKNDFVRQILSLIHTDRDFVSDLYNDYFARTQG